MRKFIPAKIFIFLCLLVLTAAITTAEESDTLTIKEQLSNEAAALKHLVTSKIAVQFLDCVAQLPDITEPRVVYVRKDPRSYLSENQYEQLLDTVKSRYERKELDNWFYYTTHYGTPLAFARPLDLIGQTGFKTLDNTKIIDFGFGSIGQLRLMASLGAEVHGIEVYELLKVLYGEPSDTGPIARADGSDSPAGSVHIHIGKFPADQAIMTSLGNQFDIIFSKNTLKRGYIHPEKEVDPKMRIDLGVDDSTFVRTVYELLKPGGYFMIYNLHPRRTLPDEETYITWSDGRSPFTKELLESTGFTVLSFDENDTEFARTMARALGWDEEMNLEEDLFGMYTLVRK